MEVRLVTIEPFNKDGIEFRNEMHYHFFITKFAESKTKDTYQQALIYLLGLTEDTREHYHIIYNARSEMIQYTSLFEEWVASTSARIIRLAFILFTGGVPTAYIEDEEGHFGEARQYSVSEIMCDPLQRYFMQAIKLRYPNYVSEYGYEQEQGKEDLTSPTSD